MSEIATRLARIEELLGRDRPQIQVEGGVGAFKEHLRASHRRPENYDYLLRCFEREFRGRDMTRITPSEVEEFIASEWSCRRASTMDKRTHQLSALFSFCSRSLQRKGSQGFTNPCSLVSMARGSPYEKNGSGFIGTRNILKLMETFDDPGRWLMAAIPITSGLRVGELLKLRPYDVSGRVLTLLSPKSGRDREVAVIPETVAKRLVAYIGHVPKNDRIFTITRGSVCRLIKRHGRQTGLDITTHDLRRWCATFWERQGDMAMVRFVLRHSSVSDKHGAMVMDPLTARYVSPLSIEEAMERQDKTMCRELGF